MSAIRRDNHATRIPNGSWFGIVTSGHRVATMRPHREYYVARTALNANTRPQEYEIVFDYVSWNQTQPPRPGEAVMLAPLQHDLCEIRNGEPDDRNLPQF